MRKILAVGINSKFVHTNVALRYISKYVESRSEQSIKLIEFTVNHPLRNILENIFKEKADILLFSVYIWNRDYVLKLVRELRKVSNAKIILGGPEVAYEAEDVLNEYPEVDVIVSGEGEIAVLELLEKSGPGASILYGKPIENLDDLPFPYNPEELHEKAKIFYYESSRGCPFNCAYCMSSIDKSVRFYSLERVKQDLKIFIDNKVRLVKFIDRTFNLQKERYMNIWKFLLENNNGITCFHFEISADLFDDEILRFLNTIPAGLFQFEIGVQSSNEKTLASVNRKTDLQKLKNNVLKINRHIHQHLDLIAGLPYEGYNSFEKSFNFVYSMRPHMLQLGFLKILKGAPISDETDKYEYKCQEFPPYEILENKFISLEEICKLKSVEVCLDLYYNSQVFSKSTDYLIRKYVDNNPFRFYEMLSEYFKHREFLDISHKLVNLYGYLYEFVLDQFGDDIFFIECLKYDYIIQGKPGSFPYWFDHKYDKDKYNKILRAKVAAGEFETLKYAYRMTEIVTFEYDIFTGNKISQTYLVNYLSDPAALSAI